MKCKYLFFSILASILFCQTTLQAAQIKVCAKCEIKSIGTAVEMANPHDTVVVQPGTYQGKQNNTR